MMRRRDFARFERLVPVLLALAFTSGCLFDAPTGYGDPVQFPVTGPVLPPVTVTIDDYANGVLSYHVDCALADDTPAAALRRQQRIVAAAVFSAWQPLLDTSDMVTIVDQKPLALPPTCAIPRSLGTGKLAAPAHGSDLRLSVGITWSERGDTMETPPARTTAVFVLSRDGKLYLTPHT